MKRKNVEVGQRVIIKRSTSEEWDAAARYIGGEFTVAVVEALDYKGEGTVLVQKVGNDAVQFWCNHRDLKRVKELPWPWPKGTPVEVTDEGREHVEGYLKFLDLQVDTPLFLGSDGSDIPPIETEDGRVICYVDDTYVKRK